MSFVAVCSRSGSPLIVRAYVPVEMASVSALLSRLPRLIEPGKYKSFIELDEHRFLYHLFDKLILTLAVPLDSNTMHDTALLKLLASIVQKACSSEITEKSVVDAAFSIVHSFDELMAYGMCELLGIDALDDVLKMESNEEALQEMITREAKEAAKLRMKQLDMQKKADAARQKHGFAAPDSSAFIKAVSPAVKEDPASTAYTTVDVASSAKPGLKLGKSRE